MRIFIFSLIFVSLALSPVSVSADVCDENGATVVFVNGILGDENSARNDKDLLRRQFLDRGGNKDVEFTNGFNPSHLKVFGDLFKSVMQAYGGGYVDYDLTNILHQMHADLKTRKVLLVGHSQGTFYTNEAYEYLIKNGIPENSIQVYNVGTPADKVAGGGNYVTSSTDKLINFVVRQLIEIGSAKKPLPANIDISLDEDQIKDLLGGHSFSGVYLKGVPERIIGDMKKGLDGLSGDYEAVLQDGCFIAPKITLTHRLEGLSFFVGDKFTAVAYGATYYARQNTVLIAKAAYNLYTISQSLVSDAIAKFGKNIFVASLPSGSPQSQEILPVSPVFQQPEESEVADELTVVGQPEILNQNSKQDQIDDLLEKIDILKRQMADLYAIEMQGKLALIDQDAKIDYDQQIKTVSIVKTSKMGGNSALVYPQLLISEVQIASFINGKTDDKQEFVELYNPSDQDVDLNQWYLQRRTKNSSGYSSFAANTLFLGKKITKNSYFLIARQGSLFDSMADIIVDNPLTEDNSLVLKNPNGDVSDKVGWGLAQEYETASVANPTSGQSISRKFVEGIPPVQGNEIDTDNNAADFESGLQTPKARHIKYVEVEPEPESEPELPDPATTPVLKKILINEIQIDSVVGTGGTNDDWVELYNPNGVDVDMSQWSLQRSPEGGLISKKNFETGHTIKAGGYFLVARSNARQNLLDMADMESSILQLSPPNGTVFLVRNQEIIENGEDVDIVDKVGFGAGAFSSETFPALLPPESKTIERKRLGLDTDDNSQDFKLSDAPTPRGAFPKTTIKDATDYSFSPGSNTPGAPIYHLLLTWQSPSTDIDFYNVQYKLNDGSWNNWLNGTQKTQEYFDGIYSLFDDHIYYFRAQATDKDGNIGSWSPEVKIDLINPVVINEVAYVGTDADAKDQWIELYNRTDNEINLAGWKIVSGSNGANVLDFSLNGTIAPHGYFILERTDDDTLSDVSANQIFTGVIGKSYLYLHSPNKRYIDEFYISNAGLAVNHYSSERVSAFAFGSADKNWKIFHSGGGQANNGKDRIGGDIFGTPGQPNSVNQMYTYYNASFIEDTMLTTLQSPYLFGGVSVFKGVTLTVEPGVIIKFEGNQSNLTVHGTLEAIGTDSQKIVFTSLRDDEFGQDTNDDGGDSLPSPGNWLGLSFTKDSVGSQLEYVNVRYGGAVLGFSPFSFGNAIWVDQTSISLKNSTVENNKNRGLLLSNSDSIIDTVVFLSQQITDWPSSDKQSKGIDIQGGSPIIENSNFLKNTYGIYIGFWYNPETGENIAGNPDYSKNNTFSDNIVADIFPLPLVILVVDPLSDAVDSMFESSGQISSDVPVDSPVDAADLLIEPPDELLIDPPTDLSADSTADIPIDMFIDVTIEIPDQILTETPPEAQPDP